MIELIRIEKACKSQAFVTRIYTENECRQARGSISKLAGNFAVKEAVAKVFGTGFTDFMPGEIEVLRDEFGKPYVNLYGKADKKRNALGIHRIHVSISNTKEYALAFAVGEGEER